MAANISLPTSELASELNPANGFFGSINGWNPSMGATAYPSAQPENAPVSSQASPSGFALQQPLQYQPPFFQNAPDQVFKPTAPITANPLSATYGDNGQLLPQATTFDSDFFPEINSSSDFFPEMNSSSGIVPSLTTTPMSTSPNTSFYPAGTPFTSGPQTPWSGYTSPQDLGLGLNDQQFSSEWDAEKSFWEDKDPQVD